MQMDLNNNMMHEYEKNPRPGRPRIRPIKERVQENRGRPRKQPEPKLPKGRPRKEYPVEDIVKDINAGMKYRDLVIKYHTSMSKISALKKNLNNNIGRQIAVQ